MGALRTPSTRRGDAAERWPFDNDLTRVICQFVPRRYAQCACHLSRVSRPAGGAAARRGSHRSPRRCRCRSPQPSKRCSGKPMQRRLCEINAPHRLRAAKERPASKASPRWVADAYRSRNTRRRGARAPSGGPAPRRRSVPPGQARRREAVDAARSRRVRVSSMWGAPSVRRQRDARWISGSRAYPCPMFRVREGVGALIEGLANFV